jgi:Flp pilus assembly protein TadB
MAGATGPRVLVAKWWRTAWGAVMADRPGLSLKPDDAWFVALLAAWVACLVAVTYLLLGWQSAGVLLTVAGLFGIATIAIQSRQPRRQDSRG